ncbi:T9SS sorting signal type C domain-containing protein [Flavobacterium sp. RNTU_13]|uniref:Ig-like domain-containing protein n=1 Tax=Flavobacterium sp. RNTU_13 TaxID=3375145 RepID=UPI003985EB98
MMKFLLAVNKTLRYSLLGAIMLLTGLKVNAQCTPSGNQTSSGQGQWIGYVYSNNTAFTTTPPASVSAFTYRGYTTQTENFDLNPGTGAISGTNICGSYADYFTVRFKMNKNYVAGYYTITVGADDGYRLSLDGGATFVSSLSDWALHSYGSKTATILLSGNTDLLLEYFENAGSSRVSFNITSLACESTAPTAVSGVTGLDCNTTSTTLTATGGTHGYNATYQWGTGTTAGQNVIAGQTGASITVTPLANTTYWVRRANGSPCNGFSDAAFQTVTLSGRSGDPSVFGNNSWNVYAYNGGNIDVSGLNYLGTYNQTGTGLNTPNSWSSSGSPSDAVGYQGCTVPADYFTFIAKRKGFPCGNYTLTMSQWDDEAVVYVNGTQVWYSATWSGSGTTSSYVGTFSLDANSTVEVRVREIGGVSNAVLNFVTSVPPTSITGNTALTCGTTSTTLTAAGGTTVGNTVYQWGTGTVAGQNIIAGATGASITVSPTANTTYWVRLINYTSCTPESAAIYTTVTVIPVPGDPSVFGNGVWNVYGYNGGNINLTGLTYLGYYTQNTLGLDTTASWGTAVSPSATVGWQGCAVPADVFTVVEKRKGFPCGRYTLTMSSWDDEAAVYVNGALVWNRTSLGISSVIGTFDLDANSTVEVRLREAYGVAYNVLNIAPSSVPPTAISGITALSCTTNSSTLTATGGSISGTTTYQWGTGTIGQNIIAGATSASITVSPTATTTYWVRLVNYNNCTPESAAVSTTVTVTASPGNPAVFGNNTWNVYAYNGSNVALTGLAYLGYYTQNTLGLNTTSSWGSYYAPSDAAGYQGCTVPVDNFTYVAKRQGFTCGKYLLTMTQWDDESVVYINGTQVWTRATNGTNVVVGTYDLDANSTIEIRTREITGASSAVLTIVLASVPPTSITGNTSLTCGTTTTTLTATGGSVSGNTTYQWGTGAVGQNIIAGATTASITVSPTATTTYWVRLVNYNNCTPESAAVTTTVTVTPVQGDPSVFGNNTWNVYAYNGSSVSLTNTTYLGYYTQNTVGFNSTSSWGTSVSPSSATNYQGCTVPNDNFTYVAKRQGFTCGRYTLTMTQWDDESVVYINGTQVWTRATNGTNVVVGTYDLDANSTIEIRTREVTGPTSAVLAIVPASVPPTSITGNNALFACGSTSTTLTAAGGSVSGNTTYQWGTGTVAGQNIIAGATGASITVSPTATTTYWVRLVNYNNCTPESAAVTTTVTVATVPGNPAVFGDGVWNAYGYSGTTLTLSDAVYKGYYTQNTLGFDTTTGTNSWADTASPSAATGWQGCTVPNDNFVLVYKRKGFSCGTYQISFTRWDDDAELYINGTRVWNRTSWSGGLVNVLAGTYTLNENTTVEFRVHENGGSCNATMILTPTSIVSVAPTAITGPLSVLCGGSTTLTAIGGVLGTNSVYEWGTGSEGTNIIAGATTASISVSPQQNTTYWVRIKNNTCSTYTAAAYYNVQATSTVAGVLSAAVTTICKNSILSSGISLTGSVGNIVKWQSANDAAFTNGVVDIANTTTTLSGAQIGPITAPKYFRALVQNGNCTAIATPALYINVPAPLVWNGSWNGTPTINTAVEIQSNLNLSTDLTVCSCEVKNNARFNVASGASLTVKGKLTVAPTATMVVNNNASLVQIDEIANEGKIQLYRNSSLVKRFDYTLWSSPVDNQQLQAFSPQTLTDRFYEYKTATDLYGRVSSQINFETAKSYLIRTPNNHPTAVPTVFTGMFEGTPHNGTINKAVAVTGKGFNAVGNPYPSPIRVNDFINANIDNMEGTLWFWRKTNDKTQSSYTTVTKLAYVANAAPGGENGYAINPGGVLNTGQGFIVKAKPTATNIVFTNAMRVGNSTNQFFRSAAPDASKYWLNITDTAGSYSQAMVGYTSEATTGYDNGIDGRIYVDNNINLYTIQDENILAIQGRPEFTDTDQVAMGFKATQAGTFTINVSDTEGVFTADQAIYLVDNVEGLVVNVKAHAYTFTTDAGTFNDRFSIIYNTTTLGTNQPVADDKSTVIFGKNGILKVNAEENIKSVMVYDILGRQLLKADNVNNLTFEGNTGSTEQVLIVKVQLASGKVAERKVLLH